jgi:putative transposase
VEDSTVIVGYKYRLLPTKKQHAALAAILESQRQLYNAALQERIDAYRKAGKNLSFYDQCKSLTECRRDLPEMASVARMTQEDTLDRLDLAFSGFFKRLRKGQKPGFPRFRSKDRFKSFTIRNSDALPVEGRRVRFKGLPGSIRFLEHRPLPRERLTQATIRADAKGWTISFQVRLPRASGHDGPAVGIDLGVSCLAALSDGTTVANPRVAKRAAKELRRRQRALSRCMKGSKRRG